MPAESILGGINQEVTQQELLSAVYLLLTDILGSLPRIDTNKRVLVSHAESNPTVSIAASQTVGTVTTVGTVSNITNISGKDISHLPQMLSGAGTQQLYNNIIFS